MGGDRRYHYPRYVWSPTGGWWNNPANWRRNTIVAGIAIALIAIPIARLSAREEVSRCMLGC